MKSSRSPKPGRIILLFLVLFLFYRGYTIVFNPFSLDKKITIEKGDTVLRVIENLSTFNKRKVKRYLYQNADVLKPLQLGSYLFSGDYSPASLIATINQGPQQSYTKITILEGWSIYDIDSFLTKKGFIQGGEYLKSVVLASMNLNGLSTTQKEFLYYFFDSNNDTMINYDDSILSNNKNTTLEGFLYPDTYYLNPNQNITDQLIKLQLQAFYQKVWSPYNNQIKAFSSRLQENNYSFTLSPYELITLASIIEKEERNKDNKPVIASVFLNRIQKKMRIDADITLCYGLLEPYSSCTPNIINRSITDITNIYNTRVHSGLTPTPISNPSVSTINALLGFQATDYLFYLHDASGQIWYALDLQGHNNNKSKHL